MTNEEYIREACLPWQEYIKEVSNRTKVEAISEIKEELKEIKEELKKMQEAIKLLEDNDPFDILDPSLTLLGNIMTLKKEKA